MSVVTGVLLCFSCSEESVELDEQVEIFPLVQQVDMWLSENSHLPLVRLDEHMCTGKHPEMIVFGGGYNKLDVDGFYSLFKGLNWEDPYNATLLLNLEDKGIKVIHAMRR